MTLTTGARLGVYEIATLLGAGGMGEVYRGRDTKLGRDVAIKVLPSSFAADPDRLARFEREARLLASLNHPNIGAIYGVEETAGVVALVLELVEGETLAARIQRLGSRGLGLAEALAIARQIANALDAAHERGIVHRDLKPANIVLTSDGVVKVLDFGLAKGAGRAGEAGGTGGSDDGLTHSPTMIGPTMDGVLLGTAPYMSPEQARGKVVDKRTDIWAFGCVLYEMLTGRRAFSGETTSDTIAAILQREPDWAPVPAGVPQSLRRLLAQCLEKDPRVRLRDIGDARVALDEPQAPPQMTPGARGASRVGERLVWTAVVLAAVAAAVYATSAFRRTPAPETRFEMSFPRDVASTFAQLAISPDGQRLVAAPTFEGGAPLWLRPIDSTTGRLLPGTEGATFPFWSPDGRSIGFFAERKLKRFDLQGESVEVITSVRVPRGGAWQTDGTILFAPDASGPLSRVRATGGEPAVATHLEKGQNDHRAPFLLPDGRHFLYYARGTAEVRGVYVARLDGSEPKRLVDADAAAVYAASGHLLFVRQGELFAQSFDVKRLALDGAAFPVAAGIAVNPGISLASLSASASGAVAYGAGGGIHTQFSWIDRSGKPLDRVGAEQTPLANPSLSPDGRHVAFSRVVGGNWDIWVTDMNGSERRFTSDPALDFNPLWSADGRRIFFQSARGGAPDLYSRSVNGGTAEEVLLKTALPKTPSDVTADGRTLLYDVSTGTSSEMWYLPLAGDAGPRPFVQTPFNARGGQFSSDGKWVAYQSDESGRYEIYVQPFPGPGERIPVSVGGGSQVRWGHRAPELFYVAGDRRLTAVPVTFAANGAIRLGRPAALFSTGFEPTLQLRQQYVVAADGQRFLMNNNTGAADPFSMTLILNWRGKP